MASKLKPMILKDEEPGLTWWNSRQKPLKKQTKITDPSKVYTHFAIAAGVLFVCILLYGYYIHIPTQMEIKYRNPRVYKMYHRKRKPKKIDVVIIDNLKRPLDKIDNSGLSDFSDISNRDIQEEKSPRPKPLSRSSSPDDDVMDLLVSKRPPINPMWGELKASLGRAREEIVSEDKPPERFRVSREHSPREEVMSEDKSGDGLQQEITSNDNSGQDIPEENMSEDESEDSELRKKSLRKDKPGRGLHNSVKSGRGLRRHSASPETPVSRSAHRVRLVHTWPDTDTPSVHEEVALSDKSENDLTQEIISEDESENSELRRLREKSMRNEKSARGVRKSGRGVCRQDTSACGPGEIKDTLESSPRDEMLKDKPKRDLCEPKDKLGRGKRKSGREKPQKKSPRGKSKKKSPRGKSKKKSLRGKSKKKSPRGKSKKKYGKDKNMKICVNKEPWAPKPKRPKPEKKQAWVEKSKHPADKSRGKRGK